MFCDWTDYSLAGVWADYLLPIVGIVGGGMALRASKFVPRPAIRIAAKVVAVATLVEGIATVLVAAIIAIMSFGGIMLAASAMLGEEQISAVVSPDGTRVAEEYYIGGGALSAGMLVVRVKYRLMPLLERDIYRGGSTSSEHVAWEDNDTLYIPGADKRIRIGLIRAELATPIQLGITAWELTGVLDQTASL